MIVTWSKYDGSLRCADCNTPFAKFEGRSNGEVPELCLRHAVESHGMSKPEVTKWEPQPMADQVMIGVAEARA